MSKYAVRESLHQAPLALAVGSVLAGGTAQAATITVDTTADSISSSACSLRAAVESANSASSVGGCAAGSSEGNEIVFDSALTGETITLNSFYGELVVTRSLNIVGPESGDPTGLTISGNDASRIFRAQAAIGQDLTFILRNMTLTEGRSASASPAPTSGGAVLAQQSNLTLTHAIVTGNTAGQIGEAFGDGGGVAVNNGSLTLKYSQVTDNVASNGGGGVNVFDGDILISQATISGNRAVAGGGGGMRVIAPGGALSSDVDIFNSTIADNVAGGPGAPPNSGSGGGIDIHGNNLSLHGSTVSNNATTGSFARGGGIALQAGPTGVEVTVQDSTISGNTTSGNFATGGGLSLRGINSEVTASLVNSTLSGNTVSGVNPNEDGTHGGGLYFAGPGRVELVHATVAFNTASGTDGLHKYTPEFAEEPTWMVFDNSLVVQPASAEIACGQTGGVIKEPLFPNSNTLATDATCTGEATGFFDIGLAPLADNGGPTRTHALSTGSVAINAAEDCLADFEIDRDQRGADRPGIGSVACDIGAFEVQMEDSIFQSRFEEIRFSADGG